MICGNCGCDDEFEFMIDPHGRDITQDESEFLPEVYITCRNCSTLHSLSDNAELKQPQSIKSAGTNKDGI
jgi:hypothetical protein